MASLTADYLSALSFNAEDVALLTRLGRYRGQQELFSVQKPEVLQALRTSATIESIESSNLLEGIVAPKQRIQALAQEASEPRTRNENEIAGYRIALALIHESATEMLLSPSVLLQLHGWLYQYLAGEGGRWKATDNQIVETDARGNQRVRFEAVSAVATPQAVEDLASQFRLAKEQGTQDPLILVPLAILDLLCIHPFSDGNGRVARLVTLMLLYQCGYQVGRYVSLERIIEESRESYYETLEASSQGWHESRHDSGPWMRYFWGVLLKAYKEFEDRVGQIGRGKGSKSREVRRVVGSRTLPFSISDLERDCPGISRDTIRLVLRQMRDEGLIKLLGRGRGAKWETV